jgi:hypothetical protein
MGCSRGTRARSWGQVCLAASWLSVSPVRRAVEEGSTLADDVTGRGTSFPHGDPSFPRADIPFPRDDPSFPRVDTSIRGVLAAYAFVRTLIRSGWTMIQGVRTTI